MVHHREMYTTPEPSRHSTSPPERTRFDDLGTSTVTRTGSLTSLMDVHELRIGLTFRPGPFPHTPPDSLSGSPRVKPEYPPLDSLPHSSPFSNHSSLVTNAGSPVKPLPSFDDFLNGVEALNRAYESTCPRTPPSPPRSLGAKAPMHHARRPQYHGYSTMFNHHQPSYFGESLFHMNNGFDEYSTSSPDAEDRHINQKYTTEEGDFIIYACHDKGDKWVTIQKAFAERFGTTPKRSVQGLQAWYYRMNLRIPVWDDDGRLIFDDEDAFEPKLVSIKCRERDGHGKNKEPLGLVQRYPERAIHYSWVEPHMKEQARDWAEKRKWQYDQRRERRRRKEQRRQKL